jgi:hypothetical protein
LHSLNETSPESQLLLQRSILSCEEFNLFLFLKVVLLGFCEFTLDFVQFLLELVVRSDGSVFLDKFGAPALVLLLEGSLEVLELLLFG